MRKTHAAALVVVLFLCLLITPSSRAFQVWVATYGNPESSPAVAYDPNYRQYLVVWEHKVSDTNMDIHARLVDEYGTVITDFIVAGTSSMETSPAVVYNEELHEYAVVWADNITGGTAAGSHQIKAKRYYGSDASDKGEFVVTSSTENDTHARYRPVIACNGHDYYWDQQLPA